MNEDLAEFIKEMSKKGMSKSEAFVAYTKGEKDKKKKTGKGKKKRK